MAYFHKTTNQSVVFIILDTNQNGSYWRTRDNEQPSLIRLVSSHCCHMTFFICFPYCFHGCQLLKCIPHSILPTAKNTLYYVYTIFSINCCNFPLIVVFVTFMDILHSTFPLSILLNELLIFHPLIFYP